MEDFLKKAANMFGELLSNSKTEAFLKGYLMGLGHRPSPVSWSLIEKDPNVFIPTEKDIERISNKVRQDAIDQAKQLLREITIEEEREIPVWLEGQ